MKTEGNKKELRQSGRMDKNSWIVESLNSANGMQKATPSADLYERILTQRNNAVKQTGTSLSWKLAAACVLVLFGLNSFVLFQSLGSDQDEFASQQSEIYTSSLITQIELY